MRWWVDGPGRQEVRKPTATPDVRTNETTEMERELSLRDASLWFEDRV